MSESKQQFNISKKSDNTDTNNITSISDKNVSDIDEPETSPSNNNTDNNDSSVSSEDLYHMLREQIRHEDELVNHRLNWLLASQAFLFAALAVLITSDKPTNYVDDSIAIWLPFGIAFTGILLNSSSFIGLRAAYKSLKSLRECWANWQDKGKAKDFPQITWTGNWYDKAITTASATPIIILTIWFVTAWAVFPFKDEYTIPIILGFYAVIVISMILSTVRN